MIKQFFSLGAIFCLLSGCADAPPEPDASYYLVRHAEKVLDVKNPPLTETGEKRAQDLAARLEAVNLDAIYSSDYKRTLQTAQPTAAQKGLTIQTYNPRDLQAIKDLLIEKDGHYLIVGHSNTTPPLAELFGMDPGEPIVEATEYDRLYVITRNGKTVTGHIETYGE